MRLAVKPVCVVRFLPFGMVLTHHCDRIRCLHNAGYSHRPFESFSGRRIFVKVPGKFSDSGLGTVNKKDSNLMRQERMRARFRVVHPK